MKYFSYGSNMSSPRLIARVPSAQFVAIGKLPGHRLRFHKKGQDGTAKCDAEHTGNQGHHVFGVVFDISASEKSALDREEGLGYGYEEKLVTVVLENGDQIEAKTYYATRIDPSLKPYHWYKKHVLLGAEEHELPFDYISKIETVESIPDPDPERHEKELSIYL
ncbi:MAG: gamma-glutamylcyclotransferase [Deltaproteobacteria bacterium]